MRQSSVRWQKKMFIALLALAGPALAAPALAVEGPLEQIIDLEGTTNTRDIGGYLTHDQRTVRTGQIIRSENLSRLTESDFRRLEELGVKTVIDLRTDREHDRAPTAWPGDHGPRFYHFPVGDADDAWYQAQKRMMARNRFSESQSLDHMVDGYRMIAENGLSSYRQLMEVVLDEANWPIVIHCNAGKDRTGIATALILEAVGVDRETIFDEYLLTNEIGRSQDKAELLAREGRRNARNGRAPSANAWYPIVGVQAEMLEAFYARVDEQYGSMDAFLAALGVDPAARDALVASLTVERTEG